MTGQRFSIIIRLLSFVFSQGKSAVYFCMDGLKNVFCPWTNQRVVLCMNWTQTNEVQIFWCDLISVFVTWLKQDQQITEYPSKEFRLFGPAKTNEQFCQLNLRFSPVKRQRTHNFTHFGIHITILLFKRVIARANIFSSIKSHFECIKTQGKKEQFSSCQCGPFAPRCKEKS